MPCRAPKISVATGDYALERGELVEDLTAASEVILALRSKRGSSPIAPWYGSRLSTIQKLTKAAPALARFHAREALQFLIDRGALRGLDVKASVVGKSLRIVVSYTDLAGKRQDIPYTHSVTA